MAVLERRCLRMIADLQSDTITQKRPASTKASIHTGMMADTFGQSRDLGKQFLCFQVMYNISYVVLEAVCFSDLQ